MDCEKFPRNLFLRGLRSFKVIDVDKSKKSLSPVLVMIFHKFFVAVKRRSLKSSQIHLSLFGSENFQDAVSY